MRSVIPTKFSHLNMALEVMNIDTTSDQTCFQFKTKCSDNMSPWHIANSASQRAKDLDSKLSADKYFHASIVEEMGELIFIDPSEFDLSCLLSPILTKNYHTLGESDDLTFSEEQSDVLVLFGSTASTFQLLFSVSCIRSELLNILLEAVSRESAHSLQLLSQLIQPVGVRSFYCSNQEIANVIERLLELFRIIDASNIKMHILRLVPELLATSGHAPKNESTFEVVGSTVQQLLELIDSISLVSSESNASQGMLREILECVCHFPLDAPALSRLKNACNDLICRSSYAPVANSFIASIVRSLFTSEVSTSFCSEDYSCFVALLRNSMSLSGVSLSEDLSFLIESLSLAFRTNRQLKLGWLLFLNQFYNKERSSSDHLLDDFATLLIAYETELSLDERLSDLFGKRRKFISLITKACTLLTEKADRPIIAEYLPNYSAIILHKRLFPCFIGLVSQGAISQKFAFLVYSLVMKQCDSGSDQAKSVVSRLCTTVCMCSPRAFGRNSRACEINVALSTLFQLTKTFPEKISPFSDVLFGTVDRFNMPEGDTLPELKDIRKLFSVVACVAFGDHSQTYLQDDLLLILRRQLISKSIKLKTFGLIGAVVILEVLCRRPTRNLSKTSGPLNSTPFSQVVNIEGSQSSILASQTVGSQVAESSVSTRGSYGHLSLKGPGTSLADDSEEVHLVVDTSSTDIVDPERDDGCHRVGVPYLTPPSRLILQLVGLVENAVRHTQLTQFKVLWFDELGAMFARLEQRLQCQQGGIGISTKLTPNARRFIIWMGNRVMREFQENFVVDNVSVSGNETNLALNDTEICEIALNVGPSWIRCSGGAAQPPLLQSTATQPSSGHPSIRKQPITGLAAGGGGCLHPSLIPGHIRLLTVSESVRSERCLDAMNAILGCPLLLPTTSILEVPLQLLCIAINCCIESVDVFADRIVVAPSASNGGEHSLASTLICRVIQIASLRFCAHAALVRRCHEASAGSSESVWEVLPTATFDPAIIARAAEGPLSSIARSSPSVRRVLLFTPTATPPAVGMKKKTRSRKRPSTSTAEATSKKRVCGVDRAIARRNKSLRCEDGADEASRVLDPILSSDCEDASTGGKNRLAAPMANSRGRVGGKTAPGLPHDRFFTSPSIMACFRELDLSAILLGLRNPHQAPRAFQLPDVLMDPYSSVSAVVKLVYDVSGVKHYGHDKSPPTQLNWLTISYLLHELQIKIDYLAGVDLQRTAGWYSFERLNALSEQLRESYLLALIPCLVRIVSALSDYFRGDLSNDDEDDEGYCVDLSHSPTDQILADSLSAALYNLAALTTGLLPTTSRLRSPETFLTMSPSRSQAPCMARLRRLAECLDNATTTPTSDLKMPLDQKRVVSMLDDDDDNANDGQSESSSESGLSVAQTLRVIQWLVAMAPDGLAHSPSALIHCSLVLSLGRIVALQLPADSEDYELPDLVGYTHSLLNTTWHPTATWQDHHSHKDCFNALVVMHLQSPWLGAGAEGPVGACLRLYLALIKSNLLPILLPRDTYVCEGPRFAYSSLTLQTVGIYGRKVLDAISTNIRKLAKQTVASSMASPDVALLTQWNIALNCLASITDATKPHGPQQAHPPGRAFLDLLPSLMKMGCVFLENLLSGVMGFLHALFK